MAANIEGNIEGLGIPSLRAEGWLGFDCLIVALSDEPPSVDAAKATLALFTSAEGLEGTRTGRKYSFSLPNST